LRYCKSFANKTATSSESRPGEIRYLRVTFVYTDPNSFRSKARRHGAKGLTVMKVSSSGGPKGPGDTRKTAKRTGGGSFADSLRRVGGAEPSHGAPEVSDMAGSAGVDGILAAQTVSDPNDEAGRRRSRQMARGEDILDRLDELRMGILLGRFSKEKLAELAQRLRQKREQGGDPALDQILAEIELRAEVEIAKYTRRA
jgi:hypothetical protein